MMFRSQFALQVPHKSPKILKDRKGCFSFFKHIYIFVLALDVELRGHLLLILTLLLVAA